ncbi:hypothetical protein FNW02_27510 [Komarekiella sp. 'clone 1']|uniref:Uncharacterized protein n=1 Tax=Komarekiella delphini-convector SJRDD-AB1 TaxID=2593771 RepID=A0AA40VTU2_9NOST|nr:hypothetical protein [Komarekiella delphini-convector]MBD6619472.1 hypothetical protein [Komarekiella delphini-convector SJRDD-AB1]
MAKIIIFDFHLSDADIFLNELTPAEAEIVSGGAIAGGYPYTAGQISSIHDGINRVEANVRGLGSTHDNNYSSVDNSDQVFIKAFPF